MQILGVGQINFWQGGSLWIGLAKSGVPPHAHYALQFSVGLKGPIRIRAGSDGWQERPAVFVPSNVPHAFDASGSIVANIFCEPDSRLGRQLLRRFGTDAPAFIDAGEAAAITAGLTRAYAGPVDDDTLNEEAIEVLRHLAATSLPVPSPDARVERAIAEIQRRLDRPISLDEIADAVHLSPSRLRHMFTESTGMPFRPFILWSRLQKALQLAVAGESWTAAAHAANFSDSAHLTRTFRRMFGVAPTALGTARDTATAPAALRTGEPG